MKYILLIGALFGCQSELDNKPAAVVPQQAAPSPKAEAAEPAAVENAPSDKEGEWKMEEGSAIEWVGAKVTGDHSGGFSKFSSTVDVVDGSLESISIVIDMGSIFSDKDKLTQHLKNEDFFDTAKFKSASFNSTGVEEKSVSGGTHVILGELDLHGVKKPIAFPATISSSENQLTIQAEFTINRMLWGVAYPGKSDNLIKEDVLIKGNITFSN